MNETDDAISGMLEHHGVKGMHWGIRNPTSSKSKPSSDFKKTAHLRGKPVHTLSNKQLKDLNERRNLETNFQRLNPSTINKGHASVKSILALGTTAITIHSMLHTSGGKAAVNAGKKLVTSTLLVKALHKKLK